MSNIYLEFIYVFYLSEEIITVCY